MKLIVEITSKEVVGSAFTVDPIDEFNLHIDKGRPSEYILGDAGKYITVDITTTPADLNNRNYCYKEDEGLYLNPNYIPYESPEAKIIRLEAENSTLKAQVQAVSTDLQGFMDYYFSQPQ